MKRIVALCVWGLLFYSIAVTEYFDVSGVAGVNNSTNRRVGWKYQTLGMMVGAKISDETLLSVSAVYLIKKSCFELYYRTNHKEHTQGDEGYYTVIDYHYSESIGDPLLKTEMSSTVIGFSYMHNAYRGLYVKGGIGFVESQEYRKYYDDNFILSTDGKYWVDGPKKSGAVSGNAGLMLRGKNVLLSVEADSYPSGFVVMVGFTL